MVLGLSFYVDHLFILYNNYICIYRCVKFSILDYLCEENVIFRVTECRVCVRHLHNSWRDAQLRYNGVCKWIFIAYGNGKSPRDKMLSCTYLSLNLKIMASKPFPMMKMYTFLWHWMWRLSIGIYASEIRYRQLFYCVLVTSTTQLF